MFVHSYVCPTPSFAHSDVWDSYVCCRTPEIYAKFHNKKILKSAIWAMIQDGFNEHPDFYNFF